MSSEDDTLGERIEKALSYPAPPKDPTDPVEQRESARKAAGIKRELEEKTGADLGASGP